MIRHGIDPFAGMIAPARVMNLRKELLRDLLPVVRASGGAIHIVSPATCFTTEGFATHAAVDGTVGGLRDAANSNHASQATGGSRPTLRQTAGGLYYLEFASGTHLARTPFLSVMTCLATAAVSYTSTSGLTQTVLSHRRSSAVNPIIGQIDMSPQTSTTGVYRAVSRNDAGSLALPVTGTITDIFNAGPLVQSIVGGGTTALRVDGVAIGSAGVPTLPTTIDVAYIGAAHNGSSAPNNFLNGRVWGSVELNAAADTRVVRLAERLNSLLCGKQI